MKALWVINPDIGNIGRHSRLFVTMDKRLYANQEEAVNAMCVDGVASAVPTNMNSCDYDIYVWVSPRFTVQEVTVNLQDELIRAVKNSGIQEESDAKS